MNSIRRAEFDIGRLEQRQPQGLVAPRAEELDVFEVRDHLGCREQLPGEQHRSPSPSLSRDIRELLCVHVDLVDLDQDAWNCLGHFLQPLGWRRTV